MASSSTLHVAICGAGFAGLGLALSLNSQALVVKSVLSLVPNGEAVLESLGLMSELSKKAFFHQNLTATTVDGTVITELLMGHRVHFKYDSMRILRANLIDTLVKTARDRNIKVEGISFDFEDGSSATASLLIGADSIHSRVRSGMCLDIVPQYAGFTAVLAQCYAGYVNLDTSKHNLMILGDNIGTYLSMAHNPDHSDLTLSVQKLHTDLNASDWKQFSRDEQALKDFVQRDYDKWPMFCQGQLDNLREETLHLWPFQVLPDLPSWLSGGKRVLLMGGAAHAMPPSAGQGTNQAFEDGHTLALVLKEVKQDNKDLGTSLKFWQSMRQERIKTIRDITLKLAEMRKPGGGTNGGVNSDTDQFELWSGIYGGLQPQEERIVAWGEGEKI